MSSSHIASDAAPRPMVPPPPAPSAAPPPPPPRLPPAYHAEITHHLATAVDLDPRCVRDVHAMGDMPKLVYQATGAMIAEDEEQDDVDGYIWEG